MATMMKGPALKKMAPWVLLLMVIGFGLQRQKTPQPEVHSVTHLAMGTLFTVSVWGVPESAADAAVAQAFARIRDIESWASRQIKSSLVYKINHAPPSEFFHVPEELALIVETALKVKTLSHGAFDPGLAYLLDLWGFGHGAPDVGKVPDKKDIQAWLEARHRKSGDGIHLDRPKNGAPTIRLDDPAFALDLGAIAKGYALDQAMEALERTGIHNALIIGGGDMIIAGSKGGKPWRIGIQHPRDHDKVMAAAEVVGHMAMATSGDYERFFMADGERQHHIFDSRTGTPSRSGLISVSVQMDKLMMADALSTAIFVLGMEKGQEFVKHLKGVEVLMVTEKGERWKSPGFQGQWLEGPQ
ncbi:MAG: FAD:protein FMN transferase [Magnetococcales bacterium]|nr:FAD:protein FMN transferase [Magnetococcales bacterium]